jgi:hypothetical protein
MLANIPPTRMPYELHLRAADAWALLLHTCCFHLSWYMSTLPPVMPQVADAIEAAFPSMVVEGNEGSGSARAGSFEVTTPEGTVIFRWVGPDRTLSNCLLLHPVPTPPS